MSKAWAQQMLNSNALILDTETTGGAKTDQIIQLSVIDMRGKALFDSLIRPTCEINPMAAKVHRLNKYQLRSAPTFTDVYEVVKSTLEKRTVIVYNVPFDRRLLKQTTETFKLDAAWIDALDWQCAMRAHADYLGVKNAPKLEGGDHSALGDCRATLRLLKQMAGIDENPVEPMRVDVAPKMPSTGAELLALLAPPIELLDWLEKVFAAKQQKGEAVPAEYARWLATWQGIRGDGPTLIDGVKAETWEQVGLVVVKTAREMGY